MGTDLNARIAASLKREAGGVEVPPMPDLDGEPGRSVPWVPVLAVVAIVALIGLAVPVVSSLRGDDAPTPGGTPSPTSTPSTTPSSPPAPDAIKTFDDLPVGELPDLPWLERGSLMLPGVGSVDDLFADVTALTQFGDGVLTYAEGTGMIRLVRTPRPDRWQVLTTQASSAPIATGAGMAVWLEGAEIVYFHANPRWTRFAEADRQALPAGCCSSAEVVRIDQHRRIFVASSDDAWVWDSYEGAEGQIDPPPDSGDFLDVVTGLGAGSLEGPIRGSDQVLVRYPNGEVGWGYVEWTDRAKYHEAERMSSASVWLGFRDGVIVQTDEGRLVVLAAGHESPQGQGSLHQVLTGGEETFDLPGDLDVHHVLDAYRRAVMVDATDSTGQRAWLRCSTQSYDCEVATLLSDDAVLPR